MSVALLKALNGDRRGAFHRHLASLKSEPRIAWYPSAGGDFRDLLYLSRAYAERNSVAGEPAPPELFLHTDYFPVHTSQFPDAPIIYSDRRTTVTVQEFEELPRCDLPLDAEIVSFPEGGKNTGRVIFMWLRVCSSLFGEFRCPVLYVFAENAAFCAKLALKFNARFSHVVRVRYGGAFGGGKANGVWINGVLERLRCEVLIAGGYENTQDGDMRAVERFPELWPEHLAPDGDERDIRHLLEFRLRRSTHEFILIRTIPGRSWSNQGEITWKIMHAGQPCPS